MPLDPTLMPINEAINVIHLALSDLNRDEATLDVRYENVRKYLQSRLTHEHMIDVEDFMAFGGALDVFYRDSLDLHARCDYLMEIYVNLLMERCRRFGRVQ
jgi:hypothetical protein